MVRFNFTLCVLLLLIMSVSCTKHAQNLQDALVTATISTASFSSEKDNVNIQESAPVQGGTAGGTTQVTITAENLNSGTANNRDYLVIAFGYTAGDVKSYSLDKREAIGAYHKSGSTQDDVALTGIATITSNHGNDGALGKELNGTFDFTTQKGIHVSSGNFRVYVSQ